MTYSKPLQKGQWSRCLCRTENFDKNASPAINLIPPAGRVCQCQHIICQALCAGSAFTVLPFASVSDTPGLAVESDSAACRNTGLGTSVEASLQHINAEATIVLHSTLIDFVHGDTMLESTVFNQRPFWNVRVLLRQTHSEAEIDFRIGVHFSSTQLNDVTKAFLLAVHTLHTVVVISDAVGYVRRNAIGP
nr:hypothetical protein CFP56_12150 [Quercus suber]